MTEASLVPAINPSLTEKQERFCQEYAVHFNATEAYRTVYDASNMTDKTVNELACRLANDGKIAARIEELRNAHARKLFSDHTVTIKRLLEIETEIALADPNDLILHMICPCRRCWGFEHQYQWIESEYADALKTWEYLRPAVKAVTPMPDIAGGFGYDGKAKPNPSCPHCLGAGEGRTSIRDTRYLPPGARRLFAGIKHTKNGVEVLMQDQNAARERIGRMLGAYKDTLRLTGGVGMLHAVLPTDPQDAERAYRAMVQGDG